MTTVGPGGMPPADGYYVQLLGQQFGPTTYADLQLRTMQGQIKPTTMIRHQEGAWFAAQDMPGLFSTREYMTALLLSIFLGHFGVDRFYLGHTGLGVVKLLTRGPVLCPFRRITGHPCPTCGLTRSAVAFLHGDVGASFHAHPFGPLLLVVAIAWAINAWARRRGHASLALPVQWRNAAVALTAISWLAWWPVHSW